MVYFKLLIVSDSAAKSMLRKFRVTPMDARSLCKICARAFDPTGGSVVRKTKSSGAVTDSPDWAIRDFALSRSNVKYLLRAPSYAGEAAVQGNERASPRLRKTVLT